MHFVFTAPRYHTNQHFAMKALLDAEHEVTFLAHSRRHSEVYESIQPVILGLFSLGRFLRMRIPPPLGFWHRMWKLRPDAVVVRNPGSAYGLLALLTARFMNRTVVFYSQTPVHRRLRWWETLVRSFPAWVARARWITPVLGDPEKHGPAFRALRYVPFPMEPQTAPQARRWFQDGTVNILCVAKFMERKNHHLFIQAISRLAKRHRVRATIIGSCSTPRETELLSEVRRSASAAVGAGVVSFKTNLSYRGVQREYAGHDLFVLPSRNEPAAVSHLEAMSHSLPVICSDSNGTQCYIRQGENGYVFKTDDLDDLVDCMERIVSDRGRLMEMGARSYALVVSEHDPEAYVEKMVAIANGND